MDGRRVACFARACCGLDTVLPGLVIVFAFVCVPFLKEHSYWSCARPYCPLKLLYLVAEWGDSVPRVGRRRPTTSRGHASFPPPRLFSSPPTPHLLTANRLVSPPIGACKKCRQTPFLYIHIPPHQKYVRYFTPPPSDGELVSTRGQTRTTPHVSAACARHARRLCRAARAAIPPSRRGVEGNGRWQAQAPRSVGPGATGRTTNSRGRNRSQRSARTTSRGWRNAATTSLQNISGQN